MTCLCKQVDEDISFVAGESRTLVFHLKKKNKEPYDATGCEGNFSLADAVNRMDEPALKKSASINGDTAVVELAPADTAHLLDVKYDYQLALRTEGGEAEIAAEGALYLKRANNTKFLLGGES